MEDCCKNSQVWGEEKESISGKLITGAIIVAAILMVGTFFFLSNPTAQATDQLNLPSYANSHPLIKSAYTFAVENPKSLNGVNCYCGCMQHVHDGRLHSRGLLDCFKNPNGNFDQHASQCDMCIKDALKAKQMEQEGKSKEEINDVIGAQYNDMGGGHAK